MESSSLPSLLETLRAAHHSRRHNALADRAQNLRRLRAMLTDHEGEWVEALREDFGKPPFETYLTELDIVVKEIDLHLRNLRRWASPRRARPFLGNLPGREIVHRQPYGVCLIIGAWNYPVNLALQPVVGAISAGNAVVLKPSEHAPATAALMARLAGEHMPDEVLRVVEGGAETAQALTGLPFDLIFYTGSSRVGRLVMAQAARNLVPVVLELGGKSPCVIHDEVDMEVAARRIWWGKCLNAGQTCVAPDHVLVHERVREAFIAESERALRTFFPGTDPSTRFTDMARIVHDGHFQRIRSLYRPEEAVIGGGADPETRRIDPTLVPVASPDGHPLMSEEIFGPVLPMVTWSDERELLGRLRSQPAPLAFYVFTRDGRFASRLMEALPFGGGCVNDTVSQLANLHLPFGGQGESGMGSYHGKAGFDAFSRPKPVVHRTFRPDPPLRYPPYGEAKMRWVRRLLRWS